MYSNHSKRGNDTKDASIMHNHALSDTKGIHVLHGFMYLADQKRPQLPFAGQVARIYFDYPHGGGWDIQVLRRHEMVSAVDIRAL